MESKDGRKILLVGLGGFGRNHLRAWTEMGRAGDLYVAERMVDRHAEARRLGVPAEQIGTDARAFLDEVDLVDVVTPTDSHFAVCSEAVEAGCDVFVEKPMAPSVAEAEKLAELARSRDRLVQVGYYYRFHPASLALKGMVGGGALGDLRYLSGDFRGFKRARTDVGVTHTDGVHFIDLFNWLVARPPVTVHAIVRDHFRRGLDDLSVVLMTYEDGTVAKVESGYIQPGRWKDKVVPDAMTTKEIYVCGAAQTAEVDFETETLTLHEVAHAPRDGTWWPTSRGSRVPRVGTATPVQMIQAELSAFLAGCAQRRARGPGPVAAGVVVARIIEAVYASASTGRPQDLSWSAAEKAAVAAEPPTGVPA